MAADRLGRVLAKFQNLPAIALPTDYPRPSGANKVIEAVQTVQLSEQVSLSLLKLALHEEDEDELEDEDVTAKNRPSAFQLLLAAFIVLLHRYTGDTDLIIASSSASANDPLVLRLPVDPADPFWAIVRRVQQVEKEAEEDAVPYSTLTEALKVDDTRPLFRVRFFDETDSPKDDFVRSTSLTTDLTITILRSDPVSSSHASFAPRISLRILYNSLLFAPSRINSIIDQLSILLRKLGSSPLSAVGSIPILTPTQRSSLPDPTADLNWCDFKGAITDIFSRNARLHPERPCVVQYTATRERVVYTYNAIRRASNILAHHLIQGGIQREEVVMVYAHRSVDLVVAVMAVLKAGATFSVIDPAYPPSRQTIYLQVAKPRGLVVLKGAGVISPTVRDFISNEINIRVEVPALELLPDSSILGGSTPGSNEDVLKNHVHLADTDPNVVIGPDSIGTLSFTTGSTGIPKGVRGRHYSLTHFFPWMSERFELSENSRFTMLSGIAHDPIQRDSKSLSD